METTNFGEHVTLDGYEGDYDLLNNKEYVLDCLNTLPAQLKMHKLAEPEIYHADDNGQNDPGGWSGFVVIAESHISIHTFPARRFVSADVYTCKCNTDVEAIKNYFIEKFKLGDVETNFIKRGTRYPLHNLA
jgi:S-adenosylmethionine decarboxylase